MEAVAVLEDVRAFQTRGGNARYVARDADGRQYTTFREAIGERTKELEGSRVRITSHAEQRGDYTEVHLHKLEPMQKRAGTGDTDEPDEIAPEEVYRKPKPLEERVAEDIEESRHPSGE